MAAQRAGYQQHVARAKPLCAPVNVGGDSPHSGGVDKQLIGRTALDHFGVPGDDSDTRLARGVCHAVHHRRERLHRQTLFEDESAGEVAGNGAADGHVVGRAADGELADIAAGKEQRIDDIAVGGEGQPVALGGEGGEVNARLVFLLAEPGVVKGLHEQPVNQLLHRLSTASVRHFHRVHASHSWLRY